MVVQSQEVAKVEFPMLFLYYDSVGLEIILSHKKIRSKYLADLRIEAREYYISGARIAN
jgi:hypothetical protein